MPDTAIAHRPMQTVEPIRARDFNASQLALIRRTVAADATSDEFDMFMQVARRAGLDPFRKQLYCVVYNKDNADRRKVSFITGIDGFRAVAARNKDYRPDDAEPAYEIDEARKGPSNPEGLVKCTVRVFKYGPDGAWHPAIGVAYWTEFAPMKEDCPAGYEWVDTGETWADSGKPKKRKQAKGDVVRTPSGKWAEMPHVMLAKCAEAQALRKGWPEDLSGIYAPEEMDQAMVDITASAEVELHEREQRIARIGGAAVIPILWKAGDQIESVPIGQMFDRAVKFLQASESVTEIEVWRTTNQIGLQKYWAEAKTDALELKKRIETRLRELQSSNGDTGAA